MGDQAGNEIPILLYFSRTFGADKCEKRFLHDSPDD